MGVAYLPGSALGDTVDETSEGEVYAMSARISHQERIQQDLDELLSQLAVLAKALIIRNGEFFPFGASIGKRGKYTLVTPVPEADQPTSHDVVDAIFSDLRSSRGSLRACGVAAMAATVEGTDAVRIELEHSEGSSLVIALPYTRGDLGAFAYGDMEAHRANRRIWPVEAPARTRSSKRAAPANAKTKAPSKATPKPSASGEPSAAAKPTKDTPNPRGTAQAKPPREARSSTTGTGYRTTRAARKPLQTQTV